MSFVAIVRRWGLLVLGLVGMVAGVILLSRPATVSFGWTAYAPLSNRTYVPPEFLDPYFWGTPILVVGTALTAGWVGFALGRRMKRPRHPEAL
jgi:heme/copper-type cytochrome/quinol oxidase subunit 1